MDSRAWDERYAAAELVWSAEPNQFIAAEVDDMAPGRALDLACGEGRNAIWLASKGWDVVGVDFSSVGIAKAGELASSRGVEVSWVCADATRYQPEPPGFDLVVVAYLQLPPEGLRAALGRGAEALAPGGTIVVVGHDATNLTDGYGGPQDPSVLYEPGEVVAALGNLVIDKAQRVRRRVDTPDGPRFAIDALVRAHRPA